MSKIIMQESGSLFGEVTIDGAKNAALPIIAATILGDSETILENIPPLVDIKNMLKIIEEMGGKYNYNEKEKTVAIDPRGINTTKTNKETVEKLRASFLYAGSILGKFKEVTTSYPGGCMIGTRPIELHLFGFEQLGAVISMEHGDIHIDGKNMKSNSIFLDFPSVGATENIIMAATLIKGTTVISNIAEEPEIIDLITLLNKMGAKIKYSAPKTLTIEGVEKLHGTRHKIMPDRIEAGTFISAVAIKEGNILLKDVNLEILKPLSSKLIPMGMEFIEESNGVRVIAKDLKRHSFNVQTLPFPGFPTDLQPQTVVLMTQCEGTSTCIETIFENRYSYIAQLKKMGADIKIDGRLCIIEKSPNLSGATVEATDLRAGAALILAGLVAKGETTVESAHHIFRGYNDIAGKFSSLGVKIKCIK